MDKAHCAFVTLGYKAANVRLGVSKKHICPWPFAKALLQGAINSSDKPLSKLEQSMSSESSLCVLQENASGQRERLLLTVCLACRWWTLPTETAGLESHQGNQLLRADNPFIFTFDWIHIRKLGEPPKWGLYFSSYSLNRFLPSYMVSSCDMPPWDFWWKYERRWDEVLV